MPIYPRRIQALQERCLEEPLPLSGRWVRTGIYLFLKCIFGESKSEILLYSHNIFDIQFDKTKSSDMQRPQQRKNGFTSKNLVRKEGIENLRASVQ